MTIIKPHMHSSLKLFLAVLFILLLGGGIWFVYEYNAVAAMRYEMKEIQKEIVGAEVINAELKNTLLTSLDPTKLEMLAQEKGLMLEQNPRYVVVGNTGR